MNADGGEIRNPKHALLGRRSRTIRDKSEARMDDCFNSAIPRRSQPFPIRNCAILNRLQRFLNRSQPFSNRNCAILNRSQPFPVRSPSIPSRSPAFPNRSPSIPSRSPGRMKRIGAADEAPDRRLAIDKRQSTIDKWRRVIPPSVLRACFGFRDSDSLLSG